MDDFAERRGHGRKPVAVQAEFHFEGMASPIRCQVSELSAGGCFVETMFTKPVGSKLDVGLWLGETKTNLHGVIATCTPQVGNGIRFVDMTSRDRDQLARFLKAL